MEENQNLSPPQEPPVEINKHKRKPWIAVLISIFIKGGGHIYAGYPKRGLIILIISILLLFLSAFAISISFFTAFLSIGASLIFFVFVLIDSYQYAKKQNPDYQLKWFNKWYVYLGIFILLWPLDNFIKPVITEAYRIPTGAMENSTLVGDYLVVDKMTYGIHFPFSIKYMIDFDKAQRNDIVVFQFPGDRDKYESEEKVNYIKRVIGMPGDKIQIINKDVYVDDTLLPNPPDAISDNLNRPKGFSNYRIFPKGSGWNEDNYGPITVPQKGDNIELNDINLDTWKVFIYRDSDLKNKGQLDALINKILNDDSLYEVKKDYYFMMGDNRNNSLDSRYWGFLPEENIIGKAQYIYFSMFESNIFAIRWDRIGKEIN